MEPIEEGPARRAGHVLGRAAGWLLFALFFERYVPRVGPFLAVLGPTAAVVLAAAAIRPERGIQAYLLIFPLINNLPYFFKIDESVPHAPAGLVLLIALFLGLSLRPGPVADGGRRSVGRPLGAFMALLAVSAVVTILRASDFRFVLPGAGPDWIVNAGGVRAGGAVMSAVFDFATFTGTGLLFLRLCAGAPSAELIRRRIRLLAASSSLACAFAVLQILGSPGLGNTSFWLRFGQINGTFTDPNAMASFLSAFVLLLLGLGLSERGPRRAAALAAIGLALAVFPFSGSRTGFLALGIGAIVFSVPLLKTAWAAQRMRARLIAAALGCAAAGLIILLAFPPTALQRRLGWSMGLVSGRVTKEAFFNRRLILWAAAGWMIRGHPAAGVGLGAYIIELPNYYRTHGLSLPGTDSAENVFLQVASELGLIGLGLFLWGCLRILAAARRSWRSARSRPETRTLVLGASAAAAALFVNALFHSYVGQFECAAMIALVLSLIRSMSPPDEPARPRVPADRRGAAAVSAVALFAVVFVWTSAHSLSIPARREAVGWEQNYGFYDRESDPDGRSFRWSRREAGLSIAIRGSELILPLRAAHPDIERRPVRVRIFLADAHFRPSVLLRDLTLADGRWTEAVCGLDGTEGREARLVILTSRSWRPRDIPGLTDPRDLAVAVGDPQFAPGR